MEALVPYETIRRLEESRGGRSGALAYMRGRSLANCIVILGRRSEHYKRANEDVSYPAWRAHESDRHRGHHPDRSPARKQSRVLFMP